MSNDAWGDIGIGTLGDDDLLRLGNSGQLITTNFSANCIRQACYELRASDTFWDVSSPDENKRLVLERGYVLGPKRHVVCITKERLALPADVLGRVLTKGQLFSIGILPVNTYADPGFEGRLGITLWNNSNRYVFITPDLRIAKIEFQRLPKAVSHPYVGQHGYETEIWPIPHHLYADMHDPYVQDHIADVAHELERSYGASVADLWRRLNFYTNRVWIQLLATVALFAAIFALHGKLSLFVSVLLGVVGNLLTVVVLSVIEARPRHIFRRSKGP